MYSLIKNENYGHTVSTYGDYVVVANPTSLRWDYASASILRTGSVDYFRYNKNTDQHDYVGTLYKQLETIDVMLAAETGSPTPPPISGSLEVGTIRTETPGTILSTQNRDLLIGTNDYTASVEDGFGWSLDMYEKLLVIGSPYFYQMVSTSASVVTASGASVEIHNLAVTELGETQSCFVQSLYNPHTDITESFGRGVSVNSSWIAVGSPEASSSMGVVYMYRNITTGSNYSWSFYQVVNAPSDAITDCRFGWDLKLNKQTGSYSQSMVVGCGNNTNAKAYYYEMITGSWVLTYTFIPNTDWQPLTFGNYMPYDMDVSSVMNTSNGYGRAVSTYDSTVIIGAPYDRTVYEFSGSSMYQQGSTYVYEKCQNFTRRMNTLLPVPNDSIQWTITENTNLSFLLDSVTTNEPNPHVFIKLNNKIYCGGWNGKLYILNDPDGALGNITTADSILGARAISAGCYSSTTGYLYFLIGSITAISPSTASILRVDPDDIVNGQTLFLDGIPLGNPLSGQGLPALGTDGDYLYTVCGFASSTSSIWKIDADTATVSSGSAPYKAHGGGQVSEDGQWVYFTGTGGKVMKFNTTTFSSSYTAVTFYNGYGSFEGSLTDDSVLFSGSLYVLQDATSDFGLWKVDADTLTWTPYGTTEAYPTKYGGYGMTTDGTHLYVLQNEEIWVYKYFNLDEGPIRFAVTGNPSEITIIEGGRAVYTSWNTYNVYSVSLPLEIPVPFTPFDLNLKTYGTPLTLKNNRMGYSVDVFDGYALSGIPKINMDSMTSCYVGNTLDQLHQCEADLEKSLSGQAMLLQKNTSSMDWEITNVYQRKKKYLSPYRAFGYDVSIDDRSMVVGAPLLLTDSNRAINLNTTSSSGMTLDDITGKAYIYNLANLRPEFHVGNVFYRNGKIIIMTSGSVFDGLFYNPINTATYEYDLQFKGQHTIFEKQIVCTVNPGEFNVSTNPSAIHRRTASLDVNGNGIFDFQDVDVILRYMQYKNTSILGLPVSTEWSSSIITTDDERSLYNWNISQSWYSPTQTSQLTSASITQWETVDTWMQTILDLNEDNKIDVRDMNIVWKYFANRLTQGNYAAYITPSCKKKLFSDVMDYLNFVSQKNSLPEINHEFQDYERLTTLDKTGSFIAPMATTIGLYAGLDLVGVAKLGSPIKITPEFPINFVVKMDY